MPQAGLKRSALMERGRVIRNLPTGSTLGKKKFSVPGGEMLGANLPPQTSAAVLSITSSKALKEVA